MGEKIKLLLTDNQKHIISEKQTNMRVQTNKLNNTKKILTSEQQK
jgi:hypothetical protein